jgi:glycosyltransferase involved in cell wall biosynthesis
MTAPILLDLTHTGHTRARTGIQRTALALLENLGPSARPICHDPFLGAWRPLESWEERDLADMTPAPKRGTRWPLHARIRGLLVAWGMRRRPPVLSGGSAYLVPEIFSPTVAAALPDIFAAVSGPRAALFHDAFALTQPELTPTNTVARYPVYLQELSRFDGIAAISEHSRRTLREYWEWLGLKDPPPVEGIPLGVDAPPKPTPTAARELPLILSVGSIEGRKNHVALLEACESLWARNFRFELRLIGLARPQTGGAALRRIEELRKAGRPIVYFSAADDALREASYAACAFTVYPSVAEGFGLPVAESIARGRPCICLGRGALLEIARGGGCLTVERADAPSFAAAIESLLASPAEVAALSEAARSRPFRSWADGPRIRRAKIAPMNDGGPLARSNQSRQLLALPLAPGARSISAAWRYLFSRSIRRQSLPAAVTTT